MAMKSKTGVDKNDNSTIMSASDRTDDNKEIGQVKLHLMSRDIDDGASTSSNDAPSSPTSSVNDLPMTKAGQVRANLAKTFLTKHNQLSSQPSFGEKLCYAFRCPPHGNVGQGLTLLVLLLLAWGASVAITGSQALPGGNLFSLLVLFVCSVLGGMAVEAIGLPPLLGMLLVGICFRSVPGISIIGDALNETSSSAIRNFALVIILMRAGLGLDPKALRALSMVVLRLAITPVLIETASVALVAKFVLGFPWLWGCMLGFLLSGVSSAVVVPCLLQLSAEGYGVAKGIPTLLIAAGSVDNVVAISGFTLMLAVAFSQGSVAFNVLKGPTEMLIGIAYGIVGGLVMWLLPNRHNRSTWMQFGMLSAGALLAVFGSKALGMGGAGALGALTISFVAGIGYRRQDAKGSGPAPTPSVRDLANGGWELLQPFLFGLIGTEIEVMQLNPDTILMGLVIIGVALVFRILTTFLVVMYSGLNLKERFFVALAWLPKATVQAAFGSVAAGYVRDLLAQTTDEVLREKLLQDQIYADQILTIAVLVILTTAPIGAIAIMKSAPKLLVQTKTEEVESV